jgi:hypothetical protein
MTRLSSNADLLRYLVELAGSFENAGLQMEAEEIRLATSLAAGMSTEFLGESLLAMRKVRRAAHAALNKSQVHDFDRVAAQLEFAFNR